MEGEAASEDAYHIIIVQTDPQDDTTYQEEVCTTEYQVGEQVISQSQQVVHQEDMPSQDPYGQHLQMLQPIQMGQQGEVSQQQIAQQIQLSQELSQQVEQVVAQQQQQQLGQPQQIVQQMPQQPQQQHVIQHLELTPQLSQQLQQHILQQPQQQEYQQTHILQQPQIITQMNSQGEQQQVIIQQVIEADYQESQPQEVVAKPVPRRKPRSKPNLSVPAENYACNICDKRFGTSNLLELHHRLHTCADCGATMPRVEDLIEHRKKHGIYCVVCTQVFQTEAELDDHMKLYHPGVAGHQCNICGKECYTDNALLVHKARHNLREGVACKVCNKVCKTEQGLFSHMKQHPGVKYSKKPCKLCGEECYNMRGLYAHMGRYHKQTIRCTICSQVLKSEQGLAGHMKWHRKEQERGLVDTTGMPRSMFTFRKSNAEKLQMAQSEGVHLCTGCGEVMTSAEALREHVKIHQRCSLCSKILPHEEDLIAHMKVHSTCSVCNKVMDNHNVLMEHMQEHPEVVCNVCGKACVSRKSFLRHRLLHLKQTPSENDDKPYACSECGKTFLYRNVLSRHMKLHPRVALSQPSKKKGSRQAESNTVPMEAAETTLEMIMEQTEEEQPSVEVQHIQQIVDAVQAMESEQAEAILKTEPISSEAMEQLTRGQESVEATMHQAGVQEAAQPENKSTEEKDGSANKENENNAGDGPEENADVKKVKKKKKKKKSKLDAAREAHLQDLAKHIRPHVTKTVYKPRMPTVRKRRVHTGLRPFQCDVCKKGFFEERSLVVHVRSHTGERPYVCNLCGKSFADRGSWTRHTRIHTGERKYVCGVCNRGFIHSSSLIIHTRTHTGEKPYYCGKCQKRFTNMSIMYRHIRKVHPETTLAEAALKDLSSQPSSNVSEEIQQAVANMLTLAGDTSEMRPTIVVPTSEKRVTKAGVFKCDICNISFQMLHHRNMHVKLHKCGTCGKMLSHVDRLADHIELKHYDQDLTKGPSYQCGVCGHESRRRFHMDMHVLTHTAERPYACLVCAKVLTREESLTAHMRIHTGERPYACNVCDKAFKQAHHLARHKEVHDEGGTPEGQKKKYPCKDCDMSFNFKQSLEQHQLKHSGIKPFECEECGKTFTWKRVLDRHMKVHTGENEPYKGEKPHKCPICSKGFRYPSFLIAHQNTHLGAKNFKCEVCLMAFGRKDALERHEFKQHGKESSKQQVDAHPEMLPQGEMMEKGEGKEQVVQYMSPQLGEQSFTVSNSGLQVMGEEETYQPPGVAQVVEIIIDSSVAGEISSAEQLSGILEAASHEAGILQNLGEDIQASEPNQSYTTMDSNTSMASIMVPSSSKTDYVPTVIQEATSYSHQYQLQNPTTGVLDPGTSTSGMVNEVVSIMDTGTTAVETVVETEVHTQQPGKSAYGMDEQVIQVPQVQGYEEVYMPVTAQQMAEEDTANQNMEEAHQFLYTQPQ